MVPVLSITCFIYPINPLPHSEEPLMSPAQVQGLWLCFSLTSAMVLLTPILVWVLPNRQQTV